jgi:DNA-binding NtrC family response regulator
MRSEGKLPPERNRWIIFVVDDEHLIASTLGEILANRGYDARPFVDPLDALHAAQLLPPNLLVTDVVMENMNGIELAIQIKEHCPDCSILLFSGHTAVTTDRNASAKLDRHNFQFLSKPIHPKTLIDAIEKIFNT